MQGQCAVQGSVHLGTPPALSRVPEVFWKHFDFPLALSLELRCKEYECWQHIGSLEFDYILFGSVMMIHM
jgi:hypothetical protein